MAAYIWGFSAKFAVYEPAPGLPSELLDRNHPMPPRTAWEVPKLVETFEVRGKRAPSGDFPGTTGFTHLLSPRAVDVMGDVFTRDGIIFPVEVEGQGDGWHLFHPTTVVDCLDIDASKVTRLPFRPAEVSAVLNPVFRADVVPSQGLFVVPECRNGDIYVCEDVKTLAMKHRLKGLVLSTDFFGNPWIS